MKSYLVSFVVFLNNRIDERSKSLIALCVTEIDTDRAVLVDETTVDDVLQGHIPGCGYRLQLLKYIWGQMSAKSRLAFVRPGWKLHFSKRASTLTTALENVQ